MSRQGRLLFAQLQQQYADADASEWQELGEHMEERIALLSAGSSARRDQLRREFAQARDNALAGRRSRQVAAALAAGGAELVRDRGDGLEEWHVAVIGDAPALLYVPAVDGSAAVDAARTALLAGKCALCKRGIEMTGNVVEVVHNSQCPARHVAE